MSRPSHGDGFTADEHSIVNRADALWTQASAAVSATDDAELRADAAAVRSAERARVTWSDRWRSAVCARGSVRVTLAGGCLVHGRAIAGGVDLAIVDAGVGVLWIVRPSAALWVVGLPSALAIGDAVTADHAPASTWAALMRDLVDCWAQVHVRDGSTISGRVIAVGADAFDVRREEGTDVAIPMTAVAALAIARRAFATCSGWVPAPCCS